MRSAVYPCVIFPSRYQGTYEGGRWVAVVAYDVPPGAVSDDVTTVQWWTKWGVHSAVATGRDPLDAYERLVEQSNGERYPDDLPEEALDVEVGS